MKAKAIIHKHPKAKLICFIFIFIIIANYFVGVFFSGYPDFLILIGLVMGFGIWVNVAILKMHNAGTAQFELSTKEKFRLKIEIGICFSIFILLLLVYLSAELF